MEPSPMIEQPLEFDLTRDPDETDPQRDRAAASGAPENDAYPACTAWLPACRVRPPVDTAVGGGDVYVFKQVTSPAPGAARSTYEFLGYSVPL